MIINTSEPNSIVSDAVKLSQSMRYKERNKNNMRSEGAENMEADE